MNTTPQLKLVRNWAAIMATGCMFFGNTEFAHSKHLSAAQAYILHYAPLAQSLSRTTGIPASIILGTALIESGHGSGINCRLLNNHFGIIASKGKTVSGSYQSVYKQYSSHEASYKDFCRIITLKKYYCRLKGSGDYRVWLQAMNHAHYSSAGNIWLERISEAIRIHKLNIYDKPLQQISWSPKYNWLNIPA